MDDTTPEVTPIEFSLRIAWIGIRVILALWLATPGAHFVYQGF
jgi:hypothetical protein